MTSYLSRTHPSEVIQTPPIPWDPYTQVLMPWGHVLQGLGLWLTQGPQACGPSERTCWSYPMNHGNSRHFSVLGLGLGTGNTGLPLFPTLRAWWEHSHLTIPSQYRVATWQEYLIMSKVLGTPRRKRYFFCLREKASGKRELVNCVLKEFTKKTREKTSGREVWGHCPEEGQVQGPEDCCPICLWFPAFCFPEGPEESHRFSAAEHSWFPAPQS